MQFHFWLKYHLFPVPNNNLQHWDANRNVVHEEVFSNKTKHGNE